MDFLKTLFKITVLRFESFPQVKKQQQQQANKQIKKKKNKKPHLSIPLTQQPKCGSTEGENLCK